MYSYHFFAFCFILYYLCFLWVVSLRTSKPFSTISYNSPDYLKSKLNELVSNSLLSFWCFIKHKAEQDEKKDHIHLYCIPSKMFQTDDLKTFLSEPDPLCPDIPLSCIGARSSKNFADWYLYVLHDIRYLASKGQSREHHYKRDLIVTSDTNELDSLINEIDMCAYTVYQTLIDAISEGKAFTDVLLTGQIPIQQIRNYAFAWECLGTVIHRSEPTHTPLVTVDGEFIGDESDFIDIT